jgi:hypothetical protein
MSKRESNDLIGRVPKARGGTNGEIAGRERGATPASVAGDEEQNVGGSRAVTGPARPSHRKGDFKPRRKTRGGTGPD